MTSLTISKLEETMGDMSVLADQLRDEQMFDEADTIDTAMLFMNLAREYAPLIDDSAPDNTPVTGDLLTLRDLCARMKDLQTKATEIKAQGAEVKMDLDDLRMRKIPDLMQHLEIQTTTFKGLGRVQLASDLRASTKKGMKPLAMQWLRDLGYEGMITETYNASTIKSLFRQQIKDGVMPPDDIFNILPFTRASIVKA